MEMTRKRKQSILKNSESPLLESLFRNPFVKIFVLSLTLLSSACSFAVVFCQKNFLNLLLHTDQKTFSLECFFLLLLFVFSFFSYLSTFFSKRICYQEACKEQRRFAEKTYEKTILLSSESRSKTKIGNVISLYSTDVLTASTLIDDIFPNLSSYIIPLLLAPFALIFLTQIDPTWIFGCLVFILTTNSLLAVRQTRFFTKHKRLATTRMEHVNEWIQNIRTIRMLGWVPFMESRIKSARETETDNRLDMVTNGSSMNSIAYSAPYFINILAVFILLYVDKKHISLGEIFGLLWIFGVILTRPIRMFPMMLVTVGDCYTSFKRLQEYWNLESEPFQTTRQHSEKKDENAPYAIEIENLNLILEKKQILKNISLKIRKGEFVAIVGAVGAGKTTLIDSLLKVYPATFEKYFIFNQDTSDMSLEELRNHFSYVPQDFFIASSTLRDNIALEYSTPTKNDKYLHRSLLLSQFDPSKQHIPLSLDTEIGERGINLSGGQKQRILLARAHFFNKDIVILDDCLSALDVHTEEQINQSLLAGDWKHKTRILITHRLSILPNCDRVLHMENGCLVEKEG